MGVSEVLAGIVGLVTPADKDCLSSGSPVRAVEYCFQPLDLHF